MIRLKVRVNVKSTARVTRRDNLRFTRVMVRFTVRVREKVTDLPL